MSASRLAKHILISLYAISIPFNQFVYGYMILLVTFLQEERLFRCKSTQSTSQGKGLVSVNGKKKGIDQYGDGAYQKPHQGHGKSVLEYALQ